MEWLLMASNGKSTMDFHIKNGVKFTYKLKALDVERERKKVSENENDFVSEKENVRVREREEVVRWKRGGRLHHMCQQE